MRMTFLRPLLALTGFGLLAGCSSVQGLMPHIEPVSFQANQSVNPRPVGQLPTNPAEKPIALPLSSADINCPTVDIAEGGAAYRAGGAENASVRYQFNIGETARQCDPAGPGQAAIKIGVAGNLVIGPAGSPGTFSVPLRITVTQEADHKPVFTKTYKVEATADAASSGQFRIVADPIVVPMSTVQLANVYSITVGFEGGGGAAAAPRAHRRRVAG
jgi:hypothetical protein